MNVSGFALKWRECRLYMQYKYCGLTVDLSEVFLPPLRYLRITVRSVPTILAMLKNYSQKCSYHPCDTQELQSEVFLPSLRYSRITVRSVPTILAILKNYSQKCSYHPCDTQELQSEVFLPPLRYSRITVRSVPTILAILKKYRKYRQNSTILNKNKVNGGRYLWCLVTSLSKKKLKIKSSGFSRSLYSVFCNS